jgi:hypothetical protein
LPWRWAALIAIVAFLIAGGALGAFLNAITTPSWLELNRLAHHGRKVEATVTSVDRGNHNQCDFHYTVAKTDHSNSASCPFETYSGAQITVTYDPHDPSVVTPDNPAGQLESDLIVLFVAATAFATVVVVSICRGYSWLVRNAS